MVTDKAGQTYFWKSTTARRELSIMIIFADTPRRHEPHLALSAPHAGMTRYTEIYQINEMISEYRK